LTSGGNKFTDFPENQMSRFHAEFPNFIHNLLIHWQLGCGPNWDIKGVLNITGVVGLCREEREARVDTPHWRGMRRAGRRCFWNDRRR